MFELVQLPQMGFFSIVGLPLFTAFVEVFEDAQPMLDAALANYEHWQALSRAPAIEQSSTPL